ncbi:glycosyltransferase [Priestia endophytica]
MIILHISSITGNKASGMSVVVPKHVQYQSYYSTVALLNCFDFHPQVKTGVPVFNYKQDCEDGDITKLPAPYNNPDLVVIHGLYIPFYSKIVKILIRNSIPYVLVPHGSLSRVAQHKKRFKKVLGNILMFNRIMRKATAIQYLSTEEEKATIASNVNSFIGCNGIRVKEKQKKLFSNKGLKLIFIGRIDLFHKGLDILIESCSQIKDDMRSKGIRLDIYGPNHEGGQVTLKEMITRNKIDDIVKVYDGVFDDEKETKLSESDIFIQTSRSEGQPLGIIEAMANGLPVIITPGTNMGNEVKISQGGWETHLNAYDIGQTILKAYDNKSNLNDFSNNAFQFIKDNFEWKKVARETVEQYKTILRGKK